MRHFLNYKSFKDVSQQSKENFFVAYAVGGPMVVPQEGIRAGLPSLNPKGPPVNLPSPLNTRGADLPPMPALGVL